MLSKIGFVTVALSVGLAIGYFGGYIAIHGDAQVNSAKVQHDAHVAINKAHATIKNLSK